MAENDRDLSKNDFVVKAEKSSVLLTKILMVKARLSLTQGQK